MSDRAIRTEQVRWSDLEVEDVLSFGPTRTGKQVWYKVAEVKLTEAGRVLARLDSGNGKTHWSTAHGPYDLVTIQRKG